MSGRSRSRSQRARLRTMYWIGVALLVVGFAGCVAVAQLWWTDDVSAAFMLPAALVTLAGAVLVGIEVAARRDARRKAAMRRPS